METVKTFDELKNDKGRRYKGYKLCYVGSINRTYWDFTSEAKEYQQTDEYKEQDRLREEKLYRQGWLSGDDAEFGYWSNEVLRKGSRGKDYPNPDYIPKKQTLYAYFTPISLDKQWGDDWDDAPYEYNAEPPYDDSYIGKGENRKRVEHEILKVPFFLPEGGWYLKFPKDYGGGNSPFCVRDINGGAAAWIYYSGKEGKSNKGSISIYAGDNPYKFMEKVLKMQKCLKEEIEKYEEENEEDYCLYD